MSGRLLITGANGYLGAHCVERWARASTREMVATWHSDREHLVASPPPHLHYEQCDLSDARAVDALFTQWNISNVVHIAALVPDGESHYLRRAVSANVAATAHLVERAADAGCARFVYCSSISVYGAAPCRPSGWDEGDQVLPTCVYGWTKHAGEECLRVASRANGLTGITLRLAGVHGGSRRGGAAFHMARAALAGQPLIVNKPASRFQLLFVDDAVDALMRALHASPPDAYSCINIASHVFPSLTDLATRIVGQCGSSSTLQTDRSGPGGDAVMNTARMSGIGFAPGAMETQLRQICDSLR